jgi:hypothetical protein
METNAGVQLELTQGIAQILYELDRAEGRQDHEFVALKRFHDTAIVHEGLSWTAD